MAWDYGETVPYLLSWFDYNQRILRWRLEPKPYYIWVSEIMLQQTRVEAVKGYFDRFVEALPDVPALARAEEEVLLKLWEGLGYYNRVRNMQKAARIMVERWNGEVPASYDALLTLPGIGAYTAGAIASTAFGIRVPAVDGNVLRVCMRISGSLSDIGKAQTKRELEEDLTRILPERVGDFNQALMELGALICLPNGIPLCENCPVAHLCQARLRGQTDFIPVRSPKKERRKEQRTLLLIEADGTYLLHRRPEKGLLAGLWEIPSLPGFLSREQVEEWCRERELPVREIVPGKEGHHIFTHVEWEMKSYQISLSQKRGEALFSGQCAWTTQEERMTGYALPSAFRTWFDPQGRKV